MIHPETRSRWRRARRSVKGDPRPRTISPAALARWHRIEGHQLEEAVVFARPVTRGDCRRLPRPCPFVGCRHHLYLDVKPTGAITVSWPHLEPWEIPESCALDAAECGERTLDEVGNLLNVSMERVRMIERQALDQLRTRHGQTLAQHRTWGHRRPLLEQNQERPSPAASGLAVPALGAAEATGEEAG